MTETEKIPKAVLTCKTKIMLQNRTLTEEEALVKAFDWYARKQLQQSERDRLGISDELIKLQERIDRLEARLEKLDPTPKPPIKAGSLAELFAEWGAE